MKFTLPDIEWGNDWQLVEDTAAEPSGKQRPKTPAGGKLELAGRSLVILRRPAAG